MSKKSKSKKPTVKITRNKNKFTISWKRGETYKEQTLWYSVTPTKKKAEKGYLNVSASQTSKVLPVLFDKFYPSKKNYLASITAKVSGRADKKTWAADTYKFTLSKPKAPKLKATLTQTNVCKFEWSINAQDTGTYIYIDCEWESIRLKNNSEKNGKKLAKYFKSGTSGYQKGTGSINSHKSITEDSYIFAGTDSYVRWFRARMRGPRGASEWAYVKHVYAKPNKAKIGNETTASENSANGIDLTLVWKAAQSNGSKPIDSTTAQYVITKPDANLTCPPNLQWTDIPTPKDTKGKDGIFVTIDAKPELDEVMFVRVNTKHDQEVTEGVPKLVQKGYLKDPEDLTVVTVDVTHKATITATNTSEVVDSKLAVVYKTSSGEELYVGVIPHGQTSVEVQCPNWDEEDEIAFSVFAFVGNYTKQTREDGVDIYDLTLLMTSENSVEEGGEVPKAPEGIEVFRTDVEGTVGVTWDWTWESANGVQLAWADHEDAWESTDQPDTFDVSTMYASRWNISGLEVGVTWYIRLRFYVKNGDNYTYGPWSDIEAGIINLSSAPSIPILELSDPIITENGETTASWVYVSNDKTEQQYAEIDWIDSENEYHKIAHTETAQHVVINAQEAEFEYGNTYDLVVKVRSASGRDSEWSDPVSVTIAEPLQCQISQTSLVEESIAINPRSFTGNPIEFETEMEEEVLKLEANVDPVQDLHGYDKPWVGGAGKNKLDPSLLKDQAAWNQITITLKPNTTYTMSSNITSAESDELKCYFYIEGGSPGDSNLIYANHSASVTTDSSGGLHIQQRRVSGTDSFQNYHWQIEEGSATSWTPYANICHITGWTGCEVDVSGVNLFDKQTSLDGYIENTDGVYHAAVGYKCTDYIKINGGDSYYIVSEQTAAKWGAWYDKDKAYISGITGYGGNALTAPNNATYIRLTIANDVTGDVDTFAVNTPSTDHDYHAYNGTTYPVSWQTEAGTVYGGSIDLVSGVLTVTKRTRIVTDSDSFTASSSGNNGFFLSDTFDPAKKAKNPSNGICSHYGTFVPYAASSSALTADYSVGVYNASSNFIEYYVRDSRFSTAQEITTYYAQQYTGGTPLQFTFDLATPQTYQLDPTTIQTLLGRNNVWSDGGLMRMRIAEDFITGYALKELPLEVTVTGAGDGGITSVQIKRDQNYSMERPNGIETIGYEDETVAIETQTGDDEIIIGDDPEELYVPLDDGARYKIVATVQDGLGQVQSAELPFIVNWTVQALQPSGTAEVIGNVVKITPTAQAQAGSYCEIYRLSADRPELIVSRGQFGTAYVDPYPALNEFGGHRIVFKTKNGDYIDEFDTMTVYDMGEDENDYIPSDVAIIDFDDEQIELEYGLNYSNTWDKDFKETKYLGGSIQGDWNKAISRKSNLSGAVITLTDAEKIASMRRLATFANICHVRTPDGSSFAADIQVQEQHDSDKYEKIATFTMSITRVDSQQEEGITYAQWIEENS